MGPRTRSAAPVGPQLVEDGPAAPGAPMEQADSQAPPAPATAAIPATPATPAVPVRKSIRILTRKDEPKTTETNPTTNKTAAIAHDSRSTRISIDQLLASPLHSFAHSAHSAHSAREQLHLYEPASPLHPIGINDLLRSRGIDRQYSTSRGFGSLAKQQHDDGDKDDDLCDAHHDDETSEEEQLSKHSSRQHGQRQRRTKQAPKQQSAQRSPQKRSTTGRFEKYSSAILNTDYCQARPPPPSPSQSSPPPPDTMIVERRIKLVTEQHNIPKAPQVEGFPMKEWTVEVYILDEAGKEKPARCFHKVVYNLHPSFANPVQTFHEPPFKCTNEGWGEFEMTIDCYTTEKGGKQTILHDLNFANPTYENIHTIQFKNPSQALQALLRETGPLPTDEDRKARKNLDGPGSSSIVSKKKKTYDLEKMADAIPRLSEDDLLHVIQLIHDNKNDDTYIMNNPDAGEFSIDLYTMPDNLCRLMWEFLVQSPEGHRLR